MSNYSLSIFCIIVGVVGGFVFSILQIWPLVLFSWIVILLGIAISRND